MRTEVKGKFQGKINGVVFEKEDLFNTTEWVMNLLENKFMKIEDTDFVRDLKNAIYLTWMEYTSIDYSDIEIACMEVIQKANSISEIQFSSDIDTGHFIRLDKNIADKKYGFIKQRNKVKDTPTINTTMFVNKMFNKYTKGEDQ